MTSLMLVCSASSKKRPGRDEAEDQSDAGSRK